MILKDLKKGDFFVKKPLSKIVYVKDDYDRSLKKFCCIKFDDINSVCTLASDREVFEPSFEF